MELKESMRDEQAKEIVKNLNDKYDLDKIEELIKSNEYEFEYKEQKYRVRMLTMPDKEELDKLRKKKFATLLQERDKEGNFVHLLTKDLIKIYKDRGIDIEEIDKKINKLDTEIYNAKLKLGEALSNKAGDSILKEYKQQIENLEVEVNACYVQKNDLLSYSMENTLLNYVAKIVTYLSLDILSGSIWKKAFKSVEDFELADEDLINSAAKYSLIMHYL